MNLRPRYSLFTLLLLTALVAGGVKLWHGPHHVVEQSEIGEAEFSFTRDWRGNRIVDGPVVERTVFGANLLDFRISYFRAGVDTGWQFCGYVRMVGFQRSLQEDAPCPLTKEERELFDQARDTELKRLAAAGLSLESQSEGLSRQ